MNIKEFGKAFRGQNKATRRAVYDDIYGLFFEATYSELGKQKAIPILRTLNKSLVPYFLGRAKAKAGKGK